MTKEQYEKLSAPFRKKPVYQKMLVFIDKGLALLIFAAYPILLLWLFIGGRTEELTACVFVPAVSFAAVSCFRKVYSAKRPYEVLEIEPLIVKETKGKSFPSRHVFSVFVIAMTFFYLNHTAGVIIAVIGVLIACVRVIGGVHFPRDVAAGAGIGILCGMIYFLL